MEGLVFLLALIPIALLVLLVINISKMNGLKGEVHLMRLQMQEQAEAGGAADFLAGFAALGVLNTRHAAEGCEP